MPAGTGRGRQIVYPRRDVVDAIRYLDRTGCQWDALPACRRLGELVGHVHACLWEVLPDAPPSLADDPRQVADADAALGRFARATAVCRDDFDAFAVAEIVWRRRLLHQVAGLQPQTEAAARPVGWTHGDLNDLSLLFTGDLVSGVLDRDRLDVRTYGLEVVRTATILFATGDHSGGDLQRIAAFTAGYRARIGIGIDALRDTAHRRWWTLVSDTGPGEGRRQRHVADVGGGPDPQHVLRCEQAGARGQHVVDVAGAAVRRLHRQVRNDWVVAVVRRG